MKTMILGLFGVSLAAAMAELLLPDREGRGVKLSLRMLTSLAVLLVIVSPLAKLFGGDYRLELDTLSGEDEQTLTQAYTTVFEKAVAEGSETLLCEGVLDFLHKEYGIDEKNATVRALFNDKGELQAVLVTLSGSALLKNPDEIDKALTEKLSCTVEVR